MLNALFVAAVVLLQMPAFAEKADVCVALQPNPQKYGATDFRRGVAKGQWAIDPAGFLFGRFQYQDSTNLIEIERLWGFGDKTVVPEGESDREIIGVQMLFNLNSDALYGVGFWRLGLTDQNDQWIDLMIQDSREFVLLRDRFGGWQPLTLLLRKPIRASQFKALEFYARTLFRQPLSPSNLLTGSRVDACIFFLERTIE